MKPCIFDDQLSRVRHELRRLERTPGTPMARRNARRRVLTAMRSLRAALDTEYPPIVDRTGVKRLKTPEGRIARLKRAGWREVDYTRAQQFALEGIRPKKIRIEDGVNSYNKYFLPLWAVAIGVVPARLREAKKSRKVRDAAITVMALS